MKKTLIILLMAIAYLACFILGASSGMIHPACYAYAGAILPLLFALIYLYACTIIRGFGAAAALNGFILVLFLIAGEADTLFILGILLLTALAELLRFPNTTRERASAGVSCHLPSPSLPTRATGGLIRKAHWPQRWKKCRQAMTS